MVDREGARSLVELGDTIDMSRPTMLKTVEHMKELGLFKFHQAKGTDKWYVYLA